MLYDFNITKLYGFYFFLKSSQLSEMTLTGTSYFNSDYKKKQHNTYFNF